MTRLLSILRWCLWAMALLACARRLRGANPGDEVIILYNTRVPESREVADYYAARRHVPTNQIFGFSLTTNEDMSRSDYHNDLEKPLARLLEEKNLWHIRAQMVHGSNETSGHIEWRVQESSIRYAVVCYGMPLRVAADPDIKEDIEASLRPELRRNEASVDTELAVLPCIEQHLPLTGPLKNPLYTATNDMAFHPTNGVLMVTRLDGPSAAIAKGLVDKALEAERDGLWGRAYFDLRATTDPGYRIGDEWMLSAADVCRKLGFETFVEDTPATFPAEFPMSQIAIYCGWYDADASGPFTRPKVEFMPGAFAYHLHSFSAATLRSTTQHWVGPLLAKGATATMGCVNEPYLATTPELSVFMARFIFFGLSFGEAAYASQPTLSWQITTIGDPLYRPFHKPAQQLHDELERNHSKLVEWSYLRLANLNLARGVPMGEMVTFLENRPILKESAVLTEKLADLYAAQGKPSSAIDTYQRALSLGPSPLQRVRLRLVLGEKLAAANRNNEAFENEQLLLRENPDYPNKAAIYRQLAVLARKIDKGEEATRFDEIVKQLESQQAK